MIHLNSFVEKHEDFWKSIPKETKAEIGRFVIQSSDGPNGWNFKQSLLKIKPEMILNFMTGPGSSGISNQVERNSQTWKGLNDSFPSSLIVSKNVAGETLNFAKLLEQKSLDNSKEAQELRSKYLEFLKNGDLLKELKPDSDEFYEYLSRVDNRTSGISEFNQSFSKIVKNKFQEKGAELMSVFQRVQSGTQTDSATLVRVVNALDVVKVTDRDHELIRKIIEKNLPKVDLTGLNFGPAYRRFLAEIFVSPSTTEADRLKSFQLLAIATARENDPAVQSLLEPYLSRMSVSEFMSLMDMEKLLNVVDEESAAGGESLLMLSGSYHDSVFVGNSV
jgi:hypothetical protein